MIKFSNRETHKKYSELVSAINIDFGYFNKAIGKLFSDNEQETQQGLVDFKKILSDLKNEITDLESTISKVSALNSSQTTKNI